MRASAASADQLWTTAAGWMAVRSWAGPWPHQLSWEYRRRPSTPIVDVLHPVAPAHVPDETAASSLLRSAARAGQPASAAVPAARQDACSGTPAAGGVR